MGDPVLAPNPASSLSVPGTGAFEILDLTPEWCFPSGGEKMIVTLCTAGLGGVGPANFTVFFGSEQV